MIREMQRLWNTLLWSAQGFAAARASEKTRRQWTLANIVSVALAFWLLAGAERAMVIGFGLLILAAELMNTAIEEAIDGISTDRHPMTKKAKDCGSAAVALTVIAKGLVWLPALVS